MNTAYRIATRALGALLALSLIGCASSTGPAQPADAGPVRASVIDQRQYDYLRLDNGLLVFTVSDPKADKAAAALSVFRGFAEDPEDLPGLAHFVEHMLFLGTDRFPKPDEYQDFITTHGGNANAYTTYDHTNFFFDVAPEAFDPALQRFARFFVAPRFDADYVARERDAVNAEFELQRKSDPWREQAVRRQLFRRDHPASRFSIGNRATLHDLPRATLPQLVREFFERNYSADQMALVLLSNASPGELARLAREHFGDIANRHIGKPAGHGPLVDVGELPAELSFRPIKDQRVLTVVFPIPSIEPYWRIQPTRYLASLIGHEGEGSLHAYLQGKGWIESLGAGAENIDGDNALLEVSIGLTEEGAEHVRDIGEALFALLETLRQKGIEVWRYDEGQRLARLAFDYQETPPPATYVSYIAGNLQHFPPAEALRAPYAMDRFDAGVIDRFLGYLTPANAIVELSTPEVETDSVTPYFGVEYSTQRLPENLLLHWSSPHLPEGIHLPQPNPFIPSDLSLVQSPVPPAPPARIVGGSDLELWYGTDTSFRVPRASLFVLLEYPAGANSPNDFAANALYTRMVREDLNAFAYPAQEAGLRYALTPNSRGTLISVGGFDDRQGELLERIFDSWRNLEIDPERLATDRAELARQWRNTRLERPYSQTLGELTRIMTTPSFEPLDLASAVERIGKQDLENWRRRQQRAMSATVFAYGNLDAPRARRLATQVRNELLAGAEPVVVPPRVTLVLDAQPYLYLMDLEHDDAAMTLYVQGHSDAIPERARFGLLAAMLGPAYFNALRTEQKLGYVVAATPRVLRRTPGITFIVQSPVAPLRVLVERTQTFLDDYCGGLPEMSEAEFEQRRQGLITRLLEADKRLGQRANRLFSDLQNGFETFDSRAQIAAAVAKLDLQQMVSTCREVEDDVSQRRMLIGAEGRFRGVSAPPPGVLTDPITFHQGRERFPE